MPPHAPTSARLRAVSAEVVEESDLDLAALVAPEVRALLAAQDYASIPESVADMHGADLASLMELLEEAEQIAFFESLSREEQIILFEFLDHEERFVLIDGVSTDTRKGVLNDISPDERADFFSDLPDGLMNKLLGELDKQERLYTLALLRCPENSAGRIMTPEFISVASTSTVRQAYKTIRRKIAGAETIYVLYVVDAEGRLVGTLSLRDLLAAKFSDPVEKVMTSDPVHAYVTTDQEELAEIGQRYDLIAIPVTTADNRMVGIVTYDDIHDVVDEEASEDILRMHGVAAQADSYFEASVGSKLKQRLVVLASLAGVSIASVLLQLHYNSVVGKASIVAAFITLLAGSTGNCGTQIAGIIIRAQSVREYSPDELKTLIVREFIVGVLMALAMSLAVFGVTLGMIHYLEPPEEALGYNSHATVSMVVSLAMFAALATINILGGLIPILMKRIGIDPAITAGPFITTAADITTVLIYFNVASWLLHLAS